MDDLPDDVAAALAARDIELPGEREALQDVLAWVLRSSPTASLPADQFIWTGTGISSTTPSSET